MKRILIFIVLAAISSRGATIPARSISVDTNAVAFPSGQLQTILNDLGQRVYSWVNPTNGITQAAGDLRWNPLYSNPAVSTNLAWTTNNAEIIVRAANTNISGVITIPSHINYLPVTQIQTNGFQSCGKMTELIMPNTITNIGNFGIYLCNALTNVVLSSGIEVINNGLFQSCSNLVSFNFPPNLKSIGINFLRSNSKTTSIEFPHGVSTFGQSLCWGDVVETIVFPETTTLVGSNIGSSNTTSITFKGNKPNLNVLVFGRCSTNLVVYRNAWATGWDTTILGVPVRVLPSAATYLIDTNGIPQNNAFSFAADGYQKFPTGFTMQWGNYDKSTTNPTHTIEFPVAFSNSVLNVQLRVVNTNAAFFANPDETSYSSTNFSILCGTNIFSVGWFAVGY
jgi:hypothetical protein